MTRKVKTKSELKEEIGRLRQRIIELELAEEKRQRIEAELRARVQQQAVVAKLGQQVLAGADLPTLLDETTLLVANVLGADFCQVLELLPDRDALLLRAGVGWQKGLVGQILVDARPDSHMGYTLFSSEPVIVEQLESDHRFRTTSLLHQHKIVSGVSVIIDGEKWPFGVLSVHTCRQRAFTKDDINFLQAVANVLATAVEHKRAQEALNEAHDQLEKRVKERTAELQLANEELRTFAYIVSHDLRAPLVNIKGFVGELGFAIEDIRPLIEQALPHLNKEQQELLTAAFNEEIPEAMTFIDASVTRMDGLVNAILKLSRLGRRELYFEPINMGALVRSTLETLAHQIEQRQVRVTVGNLPQVIADQTSMEQIIGNILSNAVLYLHEDRPGEIKISGYRNHHETGFSIQDNGRGIATEDKQKVFELFRRAGRQDVPGEGMGLAYVRTLVRRHGGRIWFESEPESGTTFTFTISNHLEQGDNHV